MSQSARAPAPMNGKGKAAAPDTSTPQVPISLLANISYKTGPPSIRNENGQLVGFVFVDITGSEHRGLRACRLAAHQRAREVSRWLVSTTRWRESSTMTSTCDHGGGSLNWRRTKPETKTFFP
jgi:hypothetical protein